MSRRNVNIKNSTHPKLLFKCILDMFISSSLTYNRYKTYNRSRNLSTAWNALVFPCVLSPCTSSSIIMINNPAFISSKIQYNSKIWNIFTISKIRFLCEYVLNCNLFLYFQHHYSSLQCHMIFRNHNNILICSRNIIIIIMLKTAE